MTGMRGVANDIAHDLRTPINRMRSRLEFTLLGNPDAAESREALAATIKETDEILATFNALLGISLVESGALKAEFKEVDLSGVAQDTVELYAPLAQERGLDLRSAIAPGLRLRGNRHLLSQALANLLDNAVKYTPSGGILRLEAMATEEGSRIIVADSGPGVPAEERARVLERFVRLEDSRGSPGSGLGLSLVAAVAALHDARLDLEDNAPGLKVILSFPDSS
jgi:signal transduction histidine kinase